MAAFAPTRAFLSPCPLAAALALAGCLAVPVLGTAQSATPAAPMAACDIAPRPAAEVLALLGTPSPPGAPVPAYPIGPLPSGRPADEATVEAIAGTVAALEACVNAGDPARLNAFFSDDWFRRLPKDEETFAGLTSAPGPFPEGDRAAFRGPWHVEVLDDGRVLAAVGWFGSEADPAPDPARTRALVFARDDGRWLIDEAIDRVARAGCDTPVPVAAAVGPPPGADRAGWPSGCGA